MNFSSVPYLVLLSVTLALFWLVAPRRWPRLGILFASSIVFYSAWKPGPLIVFFALGMVNFIAGQVMERLTDPRHRKWLMIATVSVHLGTLIVFKYLMLLFTSMGSLAHALGSTWEPPMFKLLLPIGLSFVVFQAISFIVDVYWKKTSGKRSLLHHFVFLIFFPQLVAGPILRTSELMDPLDLTPKVTTEESMQALFRIAQGVAKKLLLADIVAATLVDPVFTNPHGYSALECVIAAIAYTLQIYFDFAGYSDIAIGSGALFGLKFPENFNKPYHATNLPEFWNRWHLTLSAFLRDYLYRPLGGNQGSKFETVRNTFLVMALGGLWHGADWRFLIWGSLHGVFMGLWRVWWWKVGKPKRSEATFLRKLGGWTMMFLIVVFLRVFFRAENFGMALEYFGQLGTFTADLARVSTLAWASLAACIVFYALPEPVELKSATLFVRSPVLVRAVALIALGLVINQLSSIETAPYVYFQF